jgi:hypothetical protein
MKPEELNFRIPGFEPLFGLAELTFYDEIFERAIRETNERIERGIIELYQGPIGTNQPIGTHHICLGTMPVQDAIVKFGIDRRRER